MPEVYRNRRHTLTPTDPPDYQALVDACRILSQQQLAVYQRLYAVGLTSPGHPASPFEVQRSSKHEACLEVSLNLGLSILGAPLTLSGYTFLVRPGDNLNDIVPKCELIIKAVEADQQFVHTLACCPLATFRPCVCAVSFTCELHGVHCYGTHD